jgi:ankyrin repeat protein
VQVTKLDLWTALHLASRNGHLSVVQSLVEDGSANKDAVTKNSWTALHLASRFGHLKIVQYLVGRCGMDTNTPSTMDGMTALHFATMNGHVEIVHYLVLQGNANLDAQAGSEGLSPLHMAGMSCNLKMVNLLLEFGASIETKSEDGSTPAIYVGHFLNRQIAHFNQCGNHNFTSYTSTFLTLNWSDVLAALSPTKTVENCPGNTFVNSAQKDADSCAIY